MVAAVHTGKAPIQAGLVFVMARAVLGEHAVAIWPYNRMQIWPVIGGGVLRDERLGQAVAVDGDRAGALIEPGLKRSGGGSGKAKRN